VALLVRVHRLVSRRTDRVGGDVASAIIFVLTVARRSSAVNFRPSRQSHPFRMRQALERLDPGQEARLGRAQGRLDRPHLVGRLDLALRPEGVGPESRRIPRASSSMARPSGSWSAPRRGGGPSCFRASAITSAGGRLLAVLLEGAPRPSTTRGRGRRGLLARAVPLEVAHHEDAGLAFWMRRKGSGAKNPVG